MYHQPHLTDLLFCQFFFSSRRRHTRLQGDWSSDVCSSNLKYRDQIQVPDYHMILDNPWESTEDVMKGLRLLWTLPPPYNLLPSSLIPYPGTEFYHKSIEDGLVTDEYNQIYRRGFHTPNGSYLNFLFFM